MDQRVLSEIPISGRKLTDSFGREWTILVTDAIGPPAENAPYVLELEIRGPETVRVRLEVYAESLRADQRADEWVIANLRRYLERPSSQREEVLSL